MTGFIVYIRIESKREARNAGRALAVTGCEFPIVPIFQSLGNLNNSIAY